MYDSSKDTLLHIKRVNELLTKSACELIKRANVHDNSKLRSPEKELFDEYTPKLAGCTYGSEEYQSFLNGLKVALDHHYANNSHHPEYYPNGIRGFNLFDLIEMFMDWKAATERHKDGNILKSIDINKARFGFSEDIAAIFRNTVSFFGDCVKIFIDSIPYTVPVRVNPSCLFLISNTSPVKYTLYDGRGIENTRPVKLNEELILEDGDSFYTILNDLNIKND